MSREAVLLSQFTTSRVDLQVHIVTAYLLICPAWVGPYDCSKLHTRTFTQSCLHYVMNTTLLYRKHHARFAVNSASRLFTLHSLSTVDCYTANETIAVHLHRTILSERWENLPRSRACTDLAACGFLKKLFSACHSHNTIGVAGSHTSTQHEHSLRVSCIRRHGTACRWAMRSQTKDYGPVSTHITISRNVGFQLRPQVQVSFQTSLKPHSGRRPAAEQSSLWGTHQYSVDCRWSSSIETHQQPPVKLQENETRADTSGSGTPT